MRQGFRSLLLLSILGACFAVVGCGGPERAPEGAGMEEMDDLSVFSADPGNTEAGAEAGAGAGAGAGAEAGDTP